MVGIIRRNAEKYPSSLPKFPEQDTTTWPWYGDANVFYHSMFRKGFPNGSAGDSIRNTISGTTSFDATLFNIDGTESTDGVWNGGMTIAEGAGSANANSFISAYMDTTDQVWYMLFNDSDTSPHTLYFSKVNDAGTVTAIGNAQLGNASMNNMSHTGSYVGVLRRLGGDGSGNFGIYYVGTSGGNAAAASPYRGCDITINASDGSLSYSSIMPATYGSPYPVMDYPKIGPTDNNIIGNISGMWWGSGHTAPAATSVYGGLANTSNGKCLRQVSIGGPSINGVPWTNGYHLAVERTATTYVFSGYYGTGAYSPTEVSANALHAWIDEMAVYYGIL
jgi:hypothetical protein